MFVCSVLYVCMYVCMYEYNSMFNTFSYVCMYVRILYYDIYCIKLIYCTCIYASTVSHTCMRWYHILLSTFIRWFSRSLTPRQGQEEPQRILFRKAKFLGFLVENFLPFSITFSDYLERSASSKASDGGDADSYSISRCPIAVYVCMYVCMLTMCSYFIGSIFLI